MKKTYAAMDPLEETRAIREEISREFKTIRELGEFLRAADRQRQAILHPADAPAASSKPKAAGKPVKQRKAAKRLAHA